MVHRFGRALEGRLPDATVEAMRQEARTSETVAVGLKIFNGLRGKWKG